MSDEIISVKNDKITQSDSRSEILILSVFAVCTSVLWQFEFGYYLLYPFTILGTWFHEISHGIAAMILGAHFSKLEIFILATKYPKMTRNFLFTFSFFLIFSVIMWVRSFFGIFIILIFGIGIFFAAKKLSQRVQKLILQFLGVQALSSVYLSIGYLFSSGAQIGGTGYFSDTQVMQNELLLPYWFWAILILGISAFLLFWSLKSVYQKKAIDNV